MGQSKGGANGAQKNRVCLKIFSILITHVDGSLDKLWNYLAINRKLNLWSKFGTLMV